MEFLNKLFGNLSSGDWWAGELPSWILFSLLASFLIEIFSRFMAKRRDRPFEGWKLVIYHGGEVTDEEDIYYEDVKRFKASNFELLKMVKSYVNNYGWTYKSKPGQSRSNVNAEWITEVGKTYVINLPLAANQGRIEKKKEGSNPT